MTSRELTSVSTFRSLGDLCVGVMHLPIKFGADIFIQSGVIDIFPKLKMAAAACDVYVGGKVRVSEFMIFLDLQHCGSK